MRAMIRAFCLWLSRLLQPTPTVPPTPLPSPGGTPPAPTVTPASVADTPPLERWAKAGAILLCLAIVMMAAVASYYCWKNTGWKWLAGPAGGVIGVLLCITLAAREVKAPNRGVVLCMGRRTGKVLDEGLWLIWPFRIDRVEDEEFSVELRTKEVTAVGTCADKPVGTTIVTVYYRADKQEAAGKFYEATEDSIIRGLEDAIRSVMTKVAGQTKSEDLWAKQEALERMVDSTLRLEIPPHLDPTTLGPGVNGPDPKILGSLLAFYEKNHQEINKLLAAVGSGSHSKIERSLGIDIERVALTRVKFSEKYEQALEQKRIAQEEREGSKERAELAEEVVGQLTAKGVSGDYAVATALAIQKLPGAQVIASGQGPLSLLNITGKGGGT